jgi:ABC transporter
LTNEDEMTKILNSILDLLENESNGERVEKRYISDQVKEGSIESFYEYIFSLKYLEPLYELKLNSVNISQLSP